MVVWNICKRKFIHWRLIYKQSWRIRWSQSFLWALKTLQLSFRLGHEFCLDIKQLLDDEVSGKPCALSSLLRSRLLSDLSLNVKEFICKRVFYVVEANLVFFCDSRDNLRLELKFENLECFNDDLVSLQNIWCFNSA